MKTSELLALVAPAFFLSSVIVITQSDIVRRLLSWVQRKPMMSAVEFESYLLLKPKGFFIHKLWTCHLCQAFHSSWISSTVSVLLLGIRDPGLGVLYVTALSSIIFPFKLALLRTGRYFTYRPEKGDQLTGAGEDKVLKEGQDAVYKETQVSFNEPVSDKVLPIPKKSYAQRLDAKRKIDSSGKNVLVIKGGDELAKRALYTIKGILECDSDQGFPRCREFREAYLNELSEAEKNYCPECEKSRILTKYLDAAVAMMEKESKQPDSIEAIDTTRISRSS